MRPRTQFLLSTALLMAGLALCALEYGKMFWGNWLHSASFSCGALSIIAAAAIYVLCATKKPSVSGGTAAFLMFVYWLLFWTFPGWLALHKFIFLVFLGEAPRGM
jgi:hypothetical protein